MCIVICTCAAFNHILTMIVFTLPLGIHEWCVFQALLNFVMPALPNGKKLSKFKMVMMFLMKIRLSLYDEDLAYRFGVHVSSVSRTFHRVLDVMFVYTSSLIKWPDRETLQQTLPSSFRKFFKSCAIIIDCSGVFIEQPSDLLVRAQVWSNYKHHSTVKFLIGITGNNFFRVTVCWRKNVRQRDHRAVWFA